ncbi:Catalase-like domain containing protein [Hyaloscypha variabilis]
MRYSTETGNPGIDDRIPQHRGLGMKVFNVKGDMFEVGKGIPTQDIEFNSAPALEIADAKTTKEILGLRVKYAQDEVRNSHLEELFEETVDLDLHPNTILGDWLKDFYSKYEAEYLFQVQFLENLQDQPFEYAGKEWDAEKYPWQTVAKVVIPKQETLIPARKASWEDHIRLDPWHGLKNLQPLGSSNRLRRIVYPASAALRHKMNARKEINVTSIDQIPDGGILEA